MPAKRLSDEICDNLAKSIEKNAMGEEVYYDIDLMPVQGGSAQAVVNLWIKGILLGQHINFTFMMNPMILSVPDQCDVVIKDALDQAITMRSQHATETMEQAASEVVLPPGAAGSIPPGPSSPLRGG